MLGKISRGSRSLVLSALLIAACGTGFNDEGTSEHAGDIPGTQGGSPGVGPSGAQGGTSKASANVGKDVGGAPSEASDTVGSNADSKRANERSGKSPGAGGEAVDSEEDADDSEVLELPPNWTPAALQPPPHAWYFATDSDYVVAPPHAPDKTFWVEHQQTGRDLWQVSQWAPQLVTSTWNPPHKTFHFNRASILRLDGWSVPPIGTNAGFTILAVLRSDEPQNAGIASWWSEWGDGAWANLRNTSGLTLLDHHRLNDGTLTEMFAGNQDLGTGGHIVAWRYVPETRIVTLMVDGVLAASTPQPLVGDISPMTLYVGAMSPLPTGLFLGDISELVFVPDDISDQDIQYYTEYAANTWFNGTVPSSGQGPCIKFDLSHSPESIRCDDGNPATFGDHCSAGTCVGTVPGPGSPKELSPVAWYHAGAPEIVVTWDGISTWYDRSPERRDLLNGYWGRPTLVPNGWNDVDPQCASEPNCKPTVHFSGSNALKRNGWTGTPAGLEGAFTVLAVLKPTPGPQSSGVVSWFHPGAYGQIAAKVGPSGASALNLYRLDEILQTQDVTGTNAVGMGTRHAVAWRYENGTVKFTVDGFAQAQTHSPLSGIPTDWFLMGAASGYPTGLFTGDIAELAVIPRSITDTEVARFNAYAQSEWGGLTLCTPNCVGKANGDDNGCGGVCGCDLAAPFDPPVPAFTRTTIAEGVTFSADELTAYVSSKASSSSYDIYVATRTPTTTFGALTSMGASINSAYDELAPFLSEDGLRLYMTKFNPWSYDLAVSTRTSATDAFPATQFISALSVSGFHDQDPFLHSGSRQLYFASEQPTGTRDIYVSTLLANGSYSTPPAGLSVNLPNEEDFRPIVSPDGLTLYFASRRPGIGNDTGGDIWIARRPSTNVPFGSVTNLYALNTSITDIPAAISHDGCTFYFASTRDTGSQDFRLYQATRGTSIPASVTTSIRIVGTGSVTTTPYQCSSSCSFQGPPDTTVYLQASGTALWTGSCTGHNGNPSADGVFVFTPGGTCTVTFSNGTPQGRGGGCMSPSYCQQGLECTNGVCTCPPGSTLEICQGGDPGDPCAQASQCDPGLECTNGTCTCPAGAPCSAQCPCGPGGGPCGNDTECASGLSCTNGTCVAGHCSNSEKDGDETDVDCGGSCAPCTGGKVCNTLTDCAEGLFCEPNNGACFGLARDERVCWPAECWDVIEEGECGQPDSPCGAFCGCGVPCNTEDPASTCPGGEECVFNFGRVLNIASRDACGPGGGICPSNDPELCGNDLKLCGPHCMCVPDCSEATPENPGDGCGGMCRGVCPIGQRGCCRQDFECGAGAACLTDPDGVRTCRPTGPNGCDNRELKPPLCGTPSALCGPVCPTCTPDCSGRACGPDPECGESCGTPSAGQYCDEAGQLRTATNEPPIQVPDGNGGFRDLHDLPRPTTSEIGAIPGQFSVSEMGTAQYTIPIDVPPGRAGMTPSLSLVYQATRDNGTLGVGWRIEGLSKITRCPKTFALDGHAAAVKNDHTDAFCLDGKRLHLLLSSSGPNPEYRTIIDTFAKIESHRDPDPPILGEQPAGVPIIDRSLQGPDWFEVRTKDGRIMIYGGTRDSLQIGTTGPVDDQMYGVRQTWLLRQIRDRSGNTIDYSYDNLQRRFMNSPMPDGRRPNIVHPRAITYTGHGNTLGNRRVVFDYDTRPDPMLRFLQGGVVWSVQDRLKQITTYVDHEPVKNYRLHYDLDKDFSQVEAIEECEGASQAVCKPETRFTYETLQEEQGFEYNNAPISGGGQLDANGDGIPDFFSTQVEVEGLDADPTLVAAQIAVEVAIAAATSPLGPEISIPVSLFWSIAGPAFWGMFADEPEVNIDHFISFGTGNRNAPTNGTDASGVPCDFANSFQDYDRDGRDDLVASCGRSNGQDQNIRIALSNGDGSFRGISSIGMPPLNMLQSSHDPTPVFFDADGDSLVDVLSCSDACTIELRRRLSPGASFAPPVRFSSCTIECTGGGGGGRGARGPSCGPANGDPEPFCQRGRTHAVFDINGDGTPDLLNAWKIFARTGRDPSQQSVTDRGWRVLHFVNDISGARLEWEDVAFPSVDFSEFGDKLQLADFNSDGLQDVLYAKPTTRISGVSSEGDHAVIWLNTGNGVFMMRSIDRPVFGEGMSTRRVATTDYNSDGRVDWLEYWRGNSLNCTALNAAFLPNTALNGLTTVEYPNDLQRPSQGCGLTPGAIEFMTDFDADGSMDMSGDGRAFYGKAKHTMLLKRVVDGLGNVTTVTYDAPDTYSSATCSDPTWPAGATWPEQCLKRMTGLVSEHIESVVTDVSESLLRKTTYRYENARMSTAGHGWLGFDRRKIVEGPPVSGVIPVPTEYDPPGTEPSWTSTTINMEPVARYTLSGELTTSTTPPYLYPFAGLPRSIEIDRTKGQTALESSAHRRRTRIENTWKTKPSIAPLSFPYVDTRITSVFEAEVAAAQGGAQGDLLTRCTETMVPDEYGNTREHTVDCPDEETQTISEFLELNPNEWLISNPDFVTIRSDRRGGPEEQQVWAFDYTNGLLASITRSPGGELSERHSTHFTRDAFGNVESSTEFVQTGEASRQTVFTYDEDNVYVRTVTNQLGHKKEFVYDRRWGTPKSIVDPNGVAVQRVYDGLGHLSKTQGPNGTTTYSYATTNRTVATTIGPVFPRITIHVDREALDGTRTGSVVEELDHLARTVLSTTEGFDGVPVTSERAYDVHGRLRGATSPHTADADVIPRDLFSYDGLDRLKRVTHLPDTDTFTEIQRASVVTLDPQYWRWLQGLDCGEQNVNCPVEVELSIDEEMKKNLVVKELGGRVIRNIDGEHVDATEEATRASNYIYGAFNHLRRIQHNMLLSSPAGTPLTLFEPDAFGRNFSRTDPDSGLTTYTYNGFDEIKTSTDAESQIRTFNYDVLGRVTSILDPGVGTTTRIYDERVNALGRISETISPDGHRLVYNYEPKTANNRGLLASVEHILDSTSYPVHFTYDSLGRPDTVAYPDRQDGPPIVAKYSYDNSGFMNEVEEVGSGTARPIWRIDETLQGQLVERETFGNGTTTAYTYNSSRRFLETIDTTFASTPIKSLVYTHYKNGLVHDRTRTEDSNDPSTREHDYDALNRLSETLDTPGTSVLYDYDHLGNLTQRGTTAIAHLSTRPHLIDTVGDNNYQYDDNGNVERRAGPDIPGNIQTLTYTPFDLPKTVVGGQTGSTRTAQFEYSADEKRIVLRETGSGLDTTRYFVADLYQRVVDNFSSSTTEERFRVYAGGREVAQIVRQDGIDTTLYFHSDNLGSTDTITTSDNDVYHQAFDPFGSEPDPLTNEVTRVGFTGHEHDRDLGLIDMKGRVYDPLSGTFTSQDPVTQAPFWSQGLNPYAYVFNNPVNNTDPSGFISISPGYPAGAVVTGSWSGFAGFGFGVGSVATKLILGGGYLGLHGMPGRTASLVTGNLAANTNPGANGMVAVGLGNPVQPPVESPGLTSDQLVEALHERFEFEVAVKREEIAAMAESELANNRDAYKVSKRNGAWAPWANKCNCFVNNVLDEVGLDPNGTRFPRPPQAGELATGSNLPADFELVPQPKDAPAKGMRGDIIAQKRNYGPGGASGHAAIMTSETSLIEASGDIGLRSNSQAGAFPANNPLAKPNSVRFVRYSPQNPWVLR